MWPVSTPPGWYDDGSGTQRWWDGTRWAEQPPPPAFPAGGQPGLPGGSDSPGQSVTRPTFDLPTDASESDFCAAMQVAGEEIVDQSTQDGDATVDFGVAIEVLRATGTPSDIPDDARTGFEAIIEAMEAADGLTVDEFEEQDEAELDGEDAFGEYYTDTCASF